MFRLFLSLIYRMKVLPYINILSLDVVLGAMSCSVLLGRTWGVIPSWPSVVLLGCVVWLIYTFDHLNDVYRATNIPSTRRHHFHARHFTKLIVASVIVMLAGLVLLFRVDEQVLRLGTGLLILVSVYFLMLHFLPAKARYHKELVIAILYSAGVALPALSVQISEFTSLQLQHFLQLAGIALGNLLCFSYYEYHTDREAGFPSLLELLSTEKRRYFLIVLLLIQLVITLVSFIGHGSPPVQAVFALMILVLLGLILYAEKITNTDTYRLLGDGVFIIPLIYLIIF